MEIYELCNALRNYSLELSPPIYRESEHKSADSILQIIPDDSRPCHVDQGVLQLSQEV